MLTTQELAPHAIVADLRINNHPLLHETYYLNLALMYAAYGFYVFPVNPNKIPYKGFAWSKLATNNPDEIRAMWQAYPNGRPAVNGLKVLNLFGDGLSFVGSHLNLTNYNIGAVGGTPISSSQTGNTEAGINRDEKTSLNIYGSITCDNISDGTSIYITSEMMSVAGIANVFNGGLSSIIQTVITLKGQELLAPYIGTAEQNEYFQIIENAKSNLIKKSGGVNQFNLFCFSRNGTEDIYFDEKLDGLIVDLNDEFFYNGIDTTHKFIRVSVYDVLMGIKSLGGLKDLIMQNEDAIKPIQVFVANFNYQGN